MCDLLVMCIIIFSNISVKSTKTAKSLDFSRFPGFSRVLFGYIWEGPFPTTL